MTENIESPKKVLFLDVDGVLNTSKARSLNSLSKPLLRRLQRIVEDTGCIIVLSSTWRKLPDATRLLKNRLKYRNLFLYDYTPVLYNQWRGYEIQKWLETTDLVVQTYAILDDSPDMLPHQIPNFFQTDPDYGLTDEITNEVIRHFNKGN